MNLGDRERVMELRREKPPVGLVVVVAAAAVGSVTRLLATLLLSELKESSGGTNLGLVDLESFLLPSMELRRERLPPNCCFFNQAFSRPC